MDLAKHLFPSCLKASTLTNNDQNFTLYDKPFVSQWFPWICPHFCPYSSPSQFWLVLARLQELLSSHNAPLLREASPLSSWVLLEAATGKVWGSHTHREQGHKGPLFHSSCHSNSVSRPNTTSFLILLLNFARFVFLLLAISWNFLITEVGVSASVRCFQVLDLLFKHF